MRHRLVSVLAALAFLLALAGSASATTLWSCRETDRAGGYTRTVTFISGANVSAVQYGFGGSRVIRCTPQN